MMLLLAMTELVLTSDMKKEVDFTQSIQTGIENRSSSKKNQGTVSRRQVSINPYLLHRAITIMP